jgi:hypothetical protein
MPGSLEAFAAFPAPLGSLPELLRPAAFAGPVTPLIADVPAPAEPALGEAPGDDPEAPPADAPPAEAPPDEEPPPEPPPPPPPLCAKTDKGDSRTATKITLRTSDEDMDELPFQANAMSNKPFRKIRNKAQSSRKNFL